MRYALSWTDARIRAIRNVTPTVRMFEIVLLEGRPEAYSVGSHINIGVVIDGQPDTRSYSLVGEPGGDAYRIAVKLHPESRGGSAYMWTLEPGARVSISNPQSLFGLDFGRDEYLLIAGGIGITPIVGMALTLARRGESFRMLYAARTPDEFAFADELRGALGDRLELFAASEGRFIDARAEIDRLGPDALLAVCGPLGLLDAVRREWRAAERDPADLRYETFGSSGRFAPEPFKVVLPQHGLELTVPENKSMLDALGEAGVEVIADCRRGECGLCAVDIVEHEGEIDHRDVFFSDHERQENRKMCACVSRAIGRIVIDTAYRPD